MDGFNSDVGGRVSVAIDLVNWARRDQSAHDASLAEVFTAHGYSAPGSEVDRETINSLADAVDAVFEMIIMGDHHGAVDSLNHKMAGLGASLQLQGTTADWSLHFHAPDASFADGWLSGIAVALAVLFSSGEIERIGGCAASSCARIFLDQGKNRQRRFCSLRCQNRAKATEYRRRNSRSASNA